MVGWSSGGLQVVGWSVVVRSDGRVVSGGRVTRVLGSEWSGVVGWSGARMPKIAKVEARSLAAEGL